MSGKITAIAPTYVAQFTNTGVLLDNGQRIDASAVVSATGYVNSWEGILDGMRPLPLVYPCFPLTNTPRRNMPRYWSHAPGRPKGSEEVCRSLELSVASKPAKARVRGPNGTLCSSGSVPRHGSGKGHRATGHRRQWGNSSSRSPLPMPLKLIYLG